MVFYYKGAIHLLQSVFVANDSIFACTLRKGISDMFAEFGVSKFMNPMEGLADWNVFVIGDLRLDILHVLRILASESK